MLRAIGMRWVIQAPIVTPSGERIGVLSLVTAESLRRFNEDDLELAVELGRRAGVAIENARLYERQAATSAVLQRSLMPARDPADPGLRGAGQLPAGRRW